MINSRKVGFLLTVFVLMAALLSPVSVSADANPSLAQVLIGNWQYFYGNSVMGTIRFDGLTAGVIYDNRYGTGDFTGKFVTANVFEGTVSGFKHAPGTTINLRIDFYKPKSNPNAWSFEGWTADYTNGSFARGQKL